MSKYPGYYVKYFDGVYECAKCGKKIQMIYYKGERRKTITTHICGLPIANMERHIRACQKEEIATALKERKDET